MAEDPDSGSPPWPDELYEEATVRVGRACYGLIAEYPRWVHRRVEKFGVLTHELFHRSLSVDFTVPELFRDALAVSAGEWLVPIATLPKGPLRNFDLRDEGGRAVPVVGKEINAQISISALRTAASLSGAGEPDRLPSLFDECLERAAVGEAPEAEKAVDELIRADEAGEEASSKFLHDQHAPWLLGDLAECYLLLAVLDDVKRRRVLKYSYEFPLTWLGFTLAERLGWDSPVIETDVRAARQTASYHAEVIIPEELKIPGAFIIDEGGQQSILALDDESDRSSMHMTDVKPWQTPILVFGVSPERSGFPTVAAATAWVTALVLAVGAWLGNLNTETAPGAALSLLLAGSALFAGAVARSGEHRLVRTLFFVPRVALVVSATAGLSSGAVLVLGFCDQIVDTTWHIASVLAVVIACILSITFLKAARAGR